MHIAIKGQAFLANFFFVYNNKLLLSSFCQCFVKVYVGGDIFSDQTDKIYSIYADTFCRATRGLDIAFQSFPDEAPSSPDKLGFFH